MPRPVKEQVIVIIGASSGLGRQTAYDLADKGAAVIIAARRQQVLTELAEELKQRGARDTLAMATDVADSAQVQRLIDRPSASSPRAWSSAFSRATTSGCS